MRFTIDRFEGQWAIIEDTDKQMHKIPAILLKEFKEGDVLTILKDAHESKNRSERINKLANELFE